MPMRTDCRHYESRTYPSGETVRKCRLDLAPDAPWRCPDDCPKFEKRRWDAGWQYGSLGDSATPQEAETVNEFVAILSGGGSVGPGLMFIKVPEDKTAKNRMHVDLGSPDLDGETQRVLALGAELVGRYDEYGVTWASFRDPEGNEF